MGHRLWAWAWAWAWARGQTFNILSTDKFVLSIDKMVWVCYGVVWCAEVWVPTEGPVPEVRLWA